MDKIARSLGEYVSQAKMRIKDTLAGRRQTTNISENPIAKRATRKIGGKNKKIKKTQSGKLSPINLSLFE